MDKKQVEGFGKAALVMLWFYGVSYFGQYLVGQWARSPQLFYEQHQQGFNILVYLAIFLGVFAMSHDQHLFLTSLSVKSIKEEGKQVGICFIIASGMYLLNIGMNRLLFDFFPEYAEMSHQFNGHEVVLRFFAMVLLPAWVEEYLFRFKIQNWIKEGFGMPIAIVGQALLFGSLHYYTLQKIYATISGLLLGVIKEKISIKASLWVHLFINLLGWGIGSFMSLSMI